MSASAMETRVSLVALFRARDPISNIPRHRSALRGLDVLGDRRRPAAIASSNRAPSASAVRWHAIATSDTSDTEHTTRRRCTSTGKETSTAIGLTQRRSTFKNASRLPPPRAYVGDGSPEKEIIVLGDSAVILEDEEAKSRSGGSPSTPDHQKLIENEKIRDSMKARIADENEGYQQGHPAMRGSITDINKTMRESYKE